MALFIKLIVPPSYSQSIIMNSWQKKTPQGYCKLVHVLLKFSKKLKNLILLPPQPKNVQFLMNQYIYTVKSVQIQYLHQSFTWGPLNNVSRFATVHNWLTVPNIDKEITLSNRWYFLNLHICLSSWILNQTQWFVLFYFLLHELTLTH